MNPCGKRLGALKTRCRFSPTRIMARRMTHHRGKPHITPSTFLLPGALDEREARAEMKKRGIESIPLYPDGRPCKAPTTDGILSAFLGVRRNRLIDATGTVVRTFHDSLPPVARLLLDLLGLQRQPYGA